MEQESDFFSGPGEEQTLLASYSTTEQYAIYLLYLQDLEKKGLCASEEVQTFMDYAFGSEGQTFFYRAVKTLKTVPKDVLEAVVKSFSLTQEQYQSNIEPIRGITPEQRPSFGETTQGVEGGPAKARHLLRQVFGHWGAHRRELEFIDEAPWTFFETASPRLVTSYLESQGKEVVALILSQIKSRRARELFGLFSEEMQVQILRQMACLNDISPQKRTQIGEVVMTHLKKHNIPQLSEELKQRERLLQDISERLAQWETSDRQSQLAYIKERDPLLAQILVELPDLKRIVERDGFAFEDLENISDRTIQDLFYRFAHRLETSVLVLALKGASAEVRDHFFRNMSCRVQADVREELGFMGPKHLSDVQEAQKQVLDELWKMIEWGLAFLPQGEAEETVIA